MNNGNINNSILRIPFRRSPDAVANIIGSPANPQIRGIARFYQTDSGVLITAEVNGLPQAAGPCPASVFGFHIHESGPCTGNTEDPFADAGSHYNPKNCPHPAHAGDLPPLFSNNGSALMSVLTNRFEVAEVLGQAIIVHSRQDDFTSQPLGNAGWMIACGVILPR